MGTPKQSSAPPKNFPKNHASCGDEILREVYSARDAYAAEHGHNLNRIYADLKRSESRTGLKQIVEPPKQRSRKAGRSPEGRLRSARAVPRWTSPAPR